MKRIFGKEAKKIFYELKKLYESSPKQKAFFISKTTKFDSADNITESYNLYKILVRRKFIFLYLTKEYELVKTAARKNTEFIAQCK